MNFINKIISEASYETDSKYVNLAKKYIAKIKEYLNSFDGSDNNVIDFHGDKGYIVITLGELQVVLMDNRYYRGSSGGYINNKIASHNIQFKFDPKTKRLSYKLNESNLLHELIHYFDDKRSKDKTAMQKTGEKQQRGVADVSYFNNPYELNAHFIQHVFPVVEKYLINVDNIPNVFESFKDEVIGSSNKLKTFYNSLEPKNQQKFLKRLYKTYEGVRKAEENISDEMKDTNFENLPKFKKLNTIEKIKKYVVNFFKAA